MLLSLHLIYNTAMGLEKNEHERRSELIQVRATREEKEMIREDAKREQRTISQYLLWLANREHTRTRG